MAPVATPQLPPPSAIGEVLQASTSAPTPPGSSHPAYLHGLAATVAHDLQFQHDWTSLVIHTHSNLTHEPLPRPIISGLPPRKAYIHPDEQIEILRAEHATGTTIERKPEREWVLPSHLQEKWSLGKFAAVFDALDTVPPGDQTGGEEDEGEGEDESDTPGHQWQGKNRQMRMMLATLHDDSTVVYYIIHDGIAKPRQN